MAGILISPRFDNQVRNRSDSYKKKHGSPHFRDVLREVSTYLMDVICAVVFFPVWYQLFYNLPLNMFVEMQGEDQSETRRPFRQMEEFKYTGLAHSFLGDCAGGSQSPHRQPSSFHVILSLYRTIFKCS